ncbi:MAG: hypothetical protein IKH02_03260, partial [Prevotella sp.]|nr:hypothetical protein [Prevotella sp.]
IQRPIFILQTTESYSELGCGPSAQMIYLLVPAKVTPFSQDCKALGTAEGKSVIRGFILCVAQFVTRKKSEKWDFSTFFSRLYHDLPAANRLALGKSPKNGIFRHFSLACTTIWDNRLLPLLP